MKYWKYLNLNRAYIPTISFHSLKNLFIREQLTFGSVELKF